MRVIPLAALAPLLLLTLAQPASADAVMVTRAMAATTILEARIEPGMLTVELEIGGTDTEAFGPLIEAASSGLPVPTPEDSGISLFADGARLDGRIESRTLRTRVERDEISGEPLPKPSDEEVIFLALRYPLPGTPKTLVIEPPKNDKGYPAADIGFVIYHQGIAVNDFRYLAEGNPVHLDWEDPFYSRFERRTLNRKYGSPMNVFLYVEPFEVRKEFVVRPVDVARFAGIELAPHEPIAPEAREALLAKLAAVLKDRAPVSIDGETPEPILDRIHFLKRGLRMTRVLSPDEPLDGTNAIVGAIFVYPVDGMPKEVRLEWDLFDERITRVPASATDEAGPMPYYLTPEDPELHWVNYLKGGVIPGELEVAHLQSSIPISLAFVIALLLAIIVFGVAARRRSIGLAIGAIALIGAGWLAPPVRSFRIPVPAAVRVPSPAEAAPTIHALLYNAYRALDFRDEEVVFDRLAQSFTGDVLERVYLEMRKGLRLENQGGARVRIREVRLIDLQPGEAELPGTVRYRAKWLATGSVGHWGHTHMRTNAYDARMTLGEQGGRWKIGALDILEEQRVVGQQP